MRYFKNEMPDLKEAEVIDDQYWLNVVDHYLNAILQKVKPSFKNCDGGLYVGCAGIAYTLFKLAASKFPISNNELLLKCKEYTDISLAYVDAEKDGSNPEISFLLGPGGVYVLGAIVYHELGQLDDSQKMCQRYKNLASSCKPLLLMQYGSDEYFVGRAGYLNGALILNKHFNSEIVPTSDLHDICQSIVSSGLEYARKNHSACPLMYAYYGTEYLGAAHGLSGILLMLLAVPNFLSSRPDCMKVVRDSVDWLGHLSATFHDNIPSATDEIQRPRSEKDELVHWCHGGPGAVYVFAKAFLVFEDDKYLLLCRQIGEAVWKKGLLKKCPGICHGVAGGAYVFLLLFRITGEQLYLNRALQFAKFLQTDKFKKEARTPDCPYSLYEGTAGTICFLVDLLRPHKAHFPFFDFF